MIGLVIVSHSRRLAEGVVELAAQMGGDAVRIGVAAGLDQPGSPLGTDAVLVTRAIEQVWAADGVLVLMDLGSAVLSAELALELLPEERRHKVLLTEAPLVEGAVAAAVAARLGEPLARVAAEARGGLAGKQAHLGTPESHGPTASTAAGAFGPAASPSTDVPLTLRLAVSNPLGLHARPAARFVRTAAEFDAELAVSDVTARRGPVSARSLNGMATLGARVGDELLVEASGPQAAEALAAVSRLAQEWFGDPPEAAPVSGRSRMTPTTAGVVEDAVSPPAPGSVLHGLPVSPGLVFGPARRLQAAPIKLPDGPSQQPEGDWAALQRALAAVAEDLEQAQSAAAGRAGDYEAEIFDAQALFLSDEALLEPARDKVFRQRLNPARAWVDAVSEALAAWEALDDPYQRARAADLRAVGEQVLRRLLDQPARVAPAAEGIVVATDLTPAQTVGLDHALVQAIACAAGGPNSHSAILARSLGIPAVVGLGPSLLGVAEGVLLALDGEAGTVTVKPSPAALRAAEERRTRRERQEVEARRLARQPAATRDGVIVHVAANVAAAADAAGAVAAGADGVGLLRTEFLFLEADHMPGEDEQERAYRTAAEALDGRPLTIRTLDIGADKQLPYLPQPDEQNPFLGLRGIRLSLRHPEFLSAQLRAALRIAADHPVRIMFPMVSTVDELRRAREVLDEARASLTAAGSTVPVHLEVGIMVEVPATALLIESFVPHVDFFSVGTNDLAQYVMAAERGNAEVAALADPLHPAVLRLIERTARAAAEGGRWAAMCGEVAGHPLATPLLLGLGIAELSMAPSAIAAVKQAVRATGLGQAKELAAEAMASESAADVRMLCAAASQA